MNINEKGQLSIGDISNQTQEKYDLKVFFITNPIKNYQQLIDLAELNKDSTDFLISVREKFSIALGFNKYAEEVAKDVFDPTRQILYKYYIENLKNV